MTEPYWPTEEDFYASDTRRERSREIDYGATWMDNAGGRFRITYLVSTGELIAARVGPVPGHEVAGAHHNAVELLGWVPSEAAAEKLMAGHRAESTKPAGQGLHWVRDRCRRQAIAGRDVSETHRRRAHAASIGAKDGGGWGSGQGAQESLL